jgi:hypothetical protein
LNNGYVVAGETAPFVVNPVPVTPDATSYVGGAQANISFADSGPTLTDWLEIAPLTAPTAAYVAWQHTGGATSGTRAFSTGSLQPGTYVARFLPANGMISVGESVPFVVSQIPIGAAVSPGQVAISFTTPQTYANDWVAISPAGSAAVTYDAWAHTGGTAQGTVDVSTQQLVTGRYVARFYTGGTYNPTGETAAFTLNSIPIATDRAAYHVGDGVTVTFTEAQPAGNDWVSLSPLESSPGTYSTWVHTNSQSTVELDTSNLSPGYYVARFYALNGLVPTGESAPFTVSP